MVQDHVIGQELDKLQTHIRTLTAEIKAKQVQLKGLTDEVAIAQTQSDQAIQHAKDAATAKTAELQQLVAPLQERVSALREQQRMAELAREDRVKAYQDEEAMMKREKNSIAARLDRQIETAQARLAEMHQAVHACQQKVAAL